MSLIVVVGGLTGKDERQFAQSYNFYDGEENKSMEFDFVTNSTVFCIDPINEVHGILSVDDEH